MNANLAMYCVLGKEGERNRGRQKNSQATPLLGLVNFSGRGKRDLAVE